MPRHKTFIPHGVIPAVILPFHDDLSIDEASFRKHLRDVAATEGISAITINAHSTEVASCTFDEQKRVHAIAQDEIGAKLPIVHGIWADGSLEAARIAKAATEGGASALLVFPPAPFTLGQTPAMAVEHFKRIADATDLPIIAFQYPLATGQGYPNETILKMIDADPDPQGDQGLGRHAAAARVACPHAAEPVAAVHRAVDAKLVADGVAVARLQGPALRLGQRDPRPAGAIVQGDAGRRSQGGAGDQRPHLSARQHLLRAAVGRHAQPHEGSAGAARQMPRAVVRPPLVKIERAEIERIRQALVQAGLLPKANVRAA